MVNRDASLQIIFQSSFRFTQYFTIWHGGRGVMRCDDLRVRVSEGSWAPVERALNKLHQKVPKWARLKDYVCFILVLVNQAMLQEFHFFLYTWFHKFAAKELVSTKLQGDWNHGRFQFIYATLVTMAWGEVETNHLESDRHCRRLCLVLSKVLTSRTVGQANFWAGDDVVGGRNLQPIRWVVSVRSMICTKSLESWGVIQFEEHT